MIQRHLARADESYRIRPSRKHAARQDESCPTERPRKPSGMVPQARPNPTTGSYFLSLELENVRCFSEKQMLDLSDGNGRPARWTILFGENGTGKTTILQVARRLRAISAVPER